MVRRRSSPHRQCGTRFGIACRWPASTAVISTTLGVFAAKALDSLSHARSKGALLGFMMLPLVVPGIIFAVALLTLLSLSSAFRCLSSTVGIGHVIICLPFAIATLIPRFEGFDASLEEASADLGENAWWTFWRVTFPLILPGDRCQSTPHVHDLV